MTTPASPTPLATLYYTNVYGIVKSSDKSYTWEDRELLNRKDRGAYTLAISSICRGPKKQVDLTKSPVSKAPFEQHIAPLSYSSYFSYKAFETVWQCNSGTANYIQTFKTQKLHIQTPNDGGMFFSFYIVHDDEIPGLFNCLLITCDARIWCDLIILAYMASNHRQRKPLEYELDCCRGKGLGILIALGKDLLKDTELRRSSVEQLLENIETAIATGDELQFDHFVRSLHDFNLQLIKIRGRRKFEKGFLECVSSFVFVNQLPHSRRSKAIHENSELDEATIRAHFKEFWGIQDEPYYDLDQLTTRITNSFTAVYNLVAQRDMKISAQHAAASVRLAATSKQIAEDALRDSTAMKTIAVMTLVFLPATFLCSFFSMGMFNWNPEEAKPITKYLWIYFASLVPLTIVVIVAWVYFTKTVREKLQRWLIKKGWRKEAVNGNVWTIRENLQRWLVKKGWRTEPVKEKV